MISWKVFLVPSVAMFLGAVVSGIYETDDNFMGAMQALAAGLVLAAISTEMCPQLTENNSLQGDMCIILGFSFGIFIMVAVEFFLEGSDEENEDPLKENLMYDSPTVSADFRPTSMQLSERNLLDDKGRFSYRWQFEPRLQDSQHSHDKKLTKEDPLLAVKIKSLSSQDDPITDTEKMSQSFPTSASSNNYMKYKSTRGSEGLSTVQESWRLTFNGIVDPSMSFNKQISRIALAKESLKTPSLSWVLTIGVAVDALVDGLLLGNAAAVENEVGVVGITLAVAISVEMCFLGVTYGSSIKNQSPMLRAALSLLHPVILFGSSCAGQLLAESLKKHQNVFHGLIAFGVSSLFWLVLMDLLTRARENNKHEWVNLFVFIGIILVILMERQFIEE